MVVFASSADAAKALRAVLRDDVLKYATSLARSWSGLAGADPPKVISLLALAQLLGVVEGRWAVELWLAHKAATTLAKPEVADVLDKLLARVEGVDKVKWEERGVNLYFKVGGLEDASHTVTLRLYTDFRHFRLSCDSCSAMSAKRVLEEVAERLRPAVERLAAGEWPRWHWSSLVLPADVGWAMFLRLRHKYNVSFSIKEGDEELLRIEVLDVKLNGEAKFRLWYFKWRETRPHQPYVDVEIRPCWDKDGRVGFIGHVYASKRKGIDKEHLDEIKKLLEGKEVEGVSLKSNGKELKFTGRFRDSVLAKLGVKPELPPGEPPAVQYLGGYKFRVGDREVEFGRGYVKGGYEFNAELKFSTREEAVRFASSLRATGVDARVVGSTVRLDSDAFFGLLAAANAAPPGLTLLYRSEEGDFRVYASVEEGRMRFYFAVKHEGVWRVAEGVYAGKKVQLSRAERDVLEAVRGAVAKASEKLGRPAKVEEPTEHRDEEGKVKAYYLSLHDHHLAPFLEHAAEHVEAKPADVRLEGRRVVVKAGGVGAEVEFKLLKLHKAEYLIADDVVQTLALYKSLKEVGVRVEITPKGVKVDSEALWALVATAIERRAPNVVPAVVMPGVELLKAYSVGGMHMYIFRAEGDNYYFAVKAEGGWRAAGGKLGNRVVQIAGEAAPTVAEAINAIYREMGVERRVEVRQMKDGTPYIYLTNVDLELLGLKRQ